MFVSRELTSTVGGASVENDEDIECATIYSRIGGQLCDRQDNKANELKDSSPKSGVEPETKFLPPECLATQEVLSEGQHRITVPRCNL